MNKNLLLSHTLKVVAVLALLSAIYIVLFMSGSQEFRLLRVTGIVVLASSLASDRIGGTVIQAKDPKFDRSILYLLYQVSSIVLIISAIAGAFLIYVYQV